MGASFRLPLSNRTGCGRDARDPSEAPPNLAYTRAGATAGDHQDDRNCAWTLTAGLTELRDTLMDVIH